MDLAHKKRLILFLSPGAWVLTHGLIMFFLCVGSRRRKICPGIPYNAGSIASCSKCELVCVVRQCWAGYSMSIVIVCMLWGKVGREDGAWGEANVHMAICLYKCLCPWFALLVSYITNLRTLLSSLQPNLYMFNYNFADIRHSFWLQSFTWAKLFSFQYNDAKALNITHIVLM